MNMKIDASSSKMLNNYFRMGEEVGKTKILAQNIVEKNYSGVTRETLEVKQSLVDKMQKDYLKMEATNATRAPLKAKIDRQFSELEKLQKIMEDFRTNIIDQRNTPGFSPVEKANSTLQEIQKVLMSTNLGEYIFAGDQNQPPLAKDCDLTKISNIVEGQAVTNYTNSKPNETIYEVSVDGKELQESFMHAGDDFIRLMIGEINQFKLLGEGEEYKQIQQEAEKALDVKFIAITSALQKIDDAEEVNNEAAERMEANFSEISGNVVEGAQKFAEQKLTMSLNDQMSRFGIEMKKMLIEDLKSFN